jgi:uncharacterized membrane protein
MPVLILAYPVLVHLAVIFHRVELQWLALCCLVAVPLYIKLKAGNPRAWLLLFAAATLLYLLARAGGGKYVLYLPPVILPALAAWFFGRSLAAGKLPLITRIAIATRSDALPAELADYTRRVTWLWTLLLAALALLSAALALWAPPEVWSLFTNVLNYLILAVVFPLEYLYRRLRFRHLQHAGFIGFIRSVAATDYRRLK